jgi:DNA-binding FrmR family transcriptional regulator
MHSTLLISQPLLETMQTLQLRAERLEQEAASLRQEFARVVESVADPASVIARYESEEECYEITQAEIDAIRRMIKPRAQRTLLTLALSNKMAGRHKDRSREEKVRRMTELIEAIRAESIADGTAIDNDDEAALDD